MDIDCTQCAQALRLQRHQSAEAAGLALLSTMRIPIVEMASGAKPGTSICVHSRLFQLQTICCPKIEIGSSIASIDQALSRIAKSPLHLRDDIRPNLIMVYANRWADRGLDIRRI